MPPASHRAPDAVRWTCSAPAGCMHTCICAPGWMTAAVSFLVCEPRAGPWPPGVRLSNTAHAPVLEPWGHARRRAGCIGPTPGSRSGAGGQHVRRSRTKTPPWCAYIRQGATTCVLYTTPGARALHMHGGQVTVHARRMNAQRLHVIVVLQQLTVQVSGRGPPSVIRPLRAAPRRPQTRAASFPESW